jgi:hypothetical protein
MSENNVRLGAKKVRLRKRKSDWVRKSQTESKQVRLGAKKSD